MFVAMSPQETSEIQVLLKETAKMSTAVFPLYSRPGTPAALLPLTRRQSTVVTDSLTKQRTRKQTASVSQVLGTAGIRVTPIDRRADLSETEQVNSEPSNHDRTTSSPRAREFDASLNHRVVSFDMVEHIETDFADDERMEASGYVTQDLTGTASQLKYAQALALWYYDQGDLTEANRLYNILIEQYEATDVSSEDYLWTRLHHGEIACMTGSFQRAELELQELFDCLEFPGSTPSRFDMLVKTGKWLALSQWRQGKYIEAEATVNTYRMRLEEAGRNGNDKSLLSTLALVLVSLGAFESAWKYSRQAVQEDLTVAHRPLTAEASLAQIVAKRRFYDEHLERSREYQSHLLNHAWILFEMGYFKDAEIANSAVLENMQKLLGPQHFRTLDAASLRAWLLLLENNVHHAGEEVQRTVREIRERRGKDHPSTLQSMQALVLMYKGQGRYSDAEETARYLVSSCERNPNLGRSHPQTTNSKAILAQVLLALGKWDEAERVQRAIVTDLSPKSEQASTRPETYLFKTGLASILRIRGNWDHARSIAVRVLHEQLIRFSTEDKEDGGNKSHDFGDEVIHVNELRSILYASKYIRKQIRNSKLPDPLASSDPVRIHPSLMQTLYCVALCEQVREDANLAFAQLVLEKLHEIMCSRMAERHRLTVDVEYDLAVNHRLRGNFQKSLSLIDGVVSERRRTLDTDHPDYLLARHQRAVTLLRICRWKDALAEQEATLKAQEFLLGKSHADTILSRYTLAGIYHSLNRDQEAERLISQVIDEQSRKYSTVDNSKDAKGDHPVIIRSRARHALILLELERYAEADEEQTRVYQWRCERFGEDHDLTRSAQNDLAEIKQAAGKHQQARTMYNALIHSFDRDKETQRKHIQLDIKENPLEFQVRSNLASCHFEMGHYLDAEKEQEQLRMKLCNSKDKRGHDEREIAATFNLALTRKMLGQYEGQSSKLGALELIQIAISKAKGILGPDHPQTSDLQATMQMWIDEAGEPYDFVKDLANRRSNGVMYNSSMLFQV
jgi:tetratricopeptide (TPR) repeat protein